MRQIGLTARCTSAVFARGTFYQSEVHKNEMLARHVSAELLSAESRRRALLVR
jgi:hypothetical protein